ncbi:hypothetical protein [Microbacterium cremeum]|uniref:hypothetical protein n=1 Tax=Microbacterium cremeum TaxID=2782169 RepID=UPI00188886C3|nr:hypothetical protein [Microbacterium cremeum]
MVNDDPQAAGRELRARMRAYSAAHSSSAGRCATAAASQPSSHSAMSAGSPGPRCQGESATRTDQPADRKRSAATVAASGPSSPRSSTARR